MKTNSKSIGNNFEREFSKQLSLWASNGLNDDLFWRDNSSGARFTTRKKQNKDTIIKGDIVAIDLKYKPFTDLFFLDTKSYKSFNPFIINENNIKSNLIFKQWLKVLSDCPNTMIPIMVCHIRDRVTPDFIVVKNNTKLAYRQIIEYSILFNIERYEFKIILLDDFFKNNNWEELIKWNS